MLDARLASPIPEPDDFEAELARGLRNRDFELHLQQFWPLAAHALVGRHATDADLARIDARWCGLTRQTGTPARKNCHFKIS